ncbi:hypothetical protein KLP28_12430 [Nocardioidaceae bacterium]|nr:hypothetical protein KLP28_12430 [Nocardioidaceae bacterium]
MTRPWPGRRTADAGRYVRLTSPRTAVLDTRWPGPADFHATQLRRALNHGMPAAATRAPRLRARVSRSPLPTDLAAAVLRRLPTSTDEELDALRRDLVDAWADFSVKGLPGRRAPSLEEASLLAVSRSGGRTVFVFRQDDLHPSLVLTSARSSGRRAEADAQERAASLGIAPRQLGRLGSWLVQEGLAGLPLWIDGDRDGLTWPATTVATIEDLHDKLRLLALGTARPGNPAAALDAVFDPLGTMPLEARTVRRLEAVRRDLKALDVQVLEHRDVSAQNVTVDCDGPGPGRVTGLVDWEYARDDGIVGFDHLLAAVSLTEHAQGRYRWSDEASYELLRDGWDDAPIYAVARAALRRTLRETIGSDALAGQIEVAVMVSRLTAATRRSLAPTVAQRCLISSLELVLDR